MQVHFLTSKPGALDPPSQNQPLLATSLQTAHNLRLLPDLVQNLVSDLSTAVEARIKAAFDVSQISKELNAKGHFLLFFPVFLEAELLSRRPCIFVRGPRVQIPYSSRTNERDRSTVGKCAMEPVIISDRGHGWRMRQSLFLLYLFFWAHVDCCDLQVYTLEKVLKLKKDPISQIVFLDEAMKVGLEVLRHLCLF